MKAELEALLERLERVGELFQELTDLKTIVRELINILIKQDEVHSRV